MKEIRDSRIAVVGVGGVGGYVGGMLANYYPHVTFVARGARGESIREKGLVLHSDYKGEIIARPEAVVGSAAELGPQDIVFICVKNYSLEEGCAQLKGAVGPGTVVVPVMNGVDPAERTAKALGTGIVVSALIYIVAFANPDFSITQQGKLASLRIGTPGVAPLTMEDAAAEAEDPKIQAHEAIAYAGSILKGADIDFKASKDIEADIWRKYILNCAYNVSTARYNCNVAGLRADPVKMQEYEALVYEALAVAMKKGVHVGTEDAEGIMHRIREEQADNASSSMKRDVEAGRPAEIETFSGYIVREGQRLGVPVPVSEQFYEALKEMCR